MPRPSDDQLWQRVAVGDSDALGELYERHARAIYNFCFRLCGDWADAEDLTSVVFLEAHRKRSAAVEEGKVLSWLYGIALNVARNRRRSVRRHRAALARVPREEGSPDFGADVVARIDAERRMRALLELVAKLPRRERDVLALCGLGELSYEAAADALDVPVGTVRSRLSRARARLRELDAPFGHDAEENVGDRRFAES